MKDKIHPKVNPVVFLDVMSGAEFIATSTLRSEETKKINGVDHFIIKVETSSASHPFYTGSQKNTTKGDQVAKFMAKVAKAQKANQKNVKPATKEEDNTPKAIKKLTKAAEENTKAKAEAKAKAKATTKKAPVKKTAAKKK